MFKLKTETYDGHTIITEVHQLIPDTAATHAHCEPLVEAEPKAAEVRQKKKDMQDKNRRAGQIAQQARVLMTNIETMTVKTVLTPDEKLQKDRLDADWNTVFVEIGETQSELRALSVELDKSRREHRRCNPVFNEPGEGWFIDRGVAVVGPDESGRAKIMTETELEAAGVFLPGGQTVAEMMTLWMGKGEHEAVTVEGDTVQDHRGVVYHCKTGETWGKRTIVALGEFPGATEKEFEQLTEAEQDEIDVQNENERLAALSDADRLAEYESKRVELLAVSAQMKVEMEIEGSTAAVALTASKKFYNDGLVILQTKYGVT